MLLNIEKIKESDLGRLEEYVKNILNISDSAKLRLETDAFCPLMTTESANLNLIKNYFINRGYNIEVIGDISECILDDRRDYRAYELIFKKNKERK